MTSVSQELPPLPDQAPSVDPKDIVLPRHWLQQVREYRGLTQKALVQRMAHQDPSHRISLAGYGRLETGRRPIPTLSAGQQESLRQALAVPVEVWREVFGQPGSGERQPDL